MPNGPFVSLHNHTEFSTLDALNKVDDLFDRAKELDHPAVAITDHGVLGSHHDAYVASQRTGVKLIPGIEAYFAPDLSEKKSSHMVLVPKNENGYKNILRLNYEAYNNQASGYMGKMTPRISWEHIEKFNSDIFCLTACSNGLLSKDIVSDNMDAAESNLVRLHSVFRDRLFLEIQPHALKTDDGKVDQVKLNENLINLSRKHDIPFVATCDAHYLDKEHAKYHDMMLAIKDKKPLSDPDRFRYGVQEMYLKSHSEIVDFFGSRIGIMAMNNSLKIASACEEPHYLKSKGAILPQFPVKNQPDYLEFRTWWEENCEELPIDKAYLRYKCVLGFERLTESFSPEKKKEYWNRVKYELSILELRNFSSYMLIVADYVGWAKQNGVTVGSGRGSAAGSLVAFLISITSVDPIKYNLLFERFHNREKKAFPDIDCDFSNPDRVKTYIKDKYGKDYVAQISNWSTMSPKVVLKDVARSLEIGGDKKSAFEIANHLTSIMPDVDTIEEAIDGSGEFAKFMKQYPEVKDYSSKLQNLTRQWSVHAAGVIIGDRPLYEIIPLRIEEDEKTGESITVTQWEKTRVEDYGLVKMDVLGLNTLNVIEDCLKYIRETTESKDIKISDIRLDDPETYKMISRGENIGVFQLESSLSPLCAKIKPTDVDTVAAINALGRPSCPSEQRQSYIRRRFGQDRVRYTHQSLEPVLKDTYGISLYEESMMGIARECAGWDLNEADNLRKLTKLKGKDPQLALKTEANFIKGCMEKWGMSYEDGQKIWDEEISSFSGYGFNRCLIYSQLIRVIQKNESFWEDIEIKDVKIGSTVLSRDEATGKDIPVKVLNNHHNGRQKLFKITLDSGETVECTINHKFRTTDGRMLPLHQVLKEQASIVLRRNENEGLEHRSTSITSFFEIGEFDTYDLEVDHPDHQYYLTNGILTSNSHAISYSIISVQTAWLKCNYPSQFMCALLNGEDPNSDKVQEYLNECKRLGIKIVPPDVNKSAENYKVIEDKVIATGLSAIKGLGPAAISEIMRKQPFNNFTDFIMKGITVSFEGNELTSYEFLKLGKPATKENKVEILPFIGKSSIQSLVRSGAMDSFGRTRKDIFENYDDFRVKLKNGIKKGKSLLEQDFPPPIDEWDRKELLYNEREVLGRTISGNSHEIFSGFFRNMAASFKLKDLNSYKPGSKIRVEAIIKTKVKEFKVKQGKNLGRKFAKYLIEDLFGDTSEITLWMDDYEKYGTKFKDGIPFKAICKVDEYLGQKSLSLSELIEIFGIKE